MLYLLILATVFGKQQNLKMYWNIFFVCGYPWVQNAPAG